jgi:hypothetical protein
MAEPDDRHCSLGCFGLGAAQTDQVANEIDILAASSHGLAQSTALASTEASLDESCVTDPSNPFARLAIASRRKKRFRTVAPMPNAVSLGRAPRVLRCNWVESAAGHLGLPVAKRDMVRVRVALTNKNFSHRVSEWTAATEDSRNIPRRSRFGSGLISRSSDGHDGA